MLRNQLFTRRLRCWDKGFHAGDEQEQIKSKERNKIKYLSKDNTQRTSEIT